MDLSTIQAVWKRHRPQFFAPLGNRVHLKSFGIPDSHIHILDWWEDSSVSVSLPATSPSSTSPQATFIMACTPAQHLGNRSLFDRWHTLWSSWAVTESLPASSPRAPKQLFFGGDTGYRAVSGVPGEDERALPHCPAFADIGAKFGRFDLALLPIGAYAPRLFLSGMHASPGDAVEIFKDVKAERAVGMHWG